MNDSKHKKELKNEELKQRKRFYHLVILIIILNLLFGALEGLALAGVNGLVLVSQLLPVIKDFFIIFYLSKSFINIRRLMLKYHSQKYEEVKVALWVYFIFDVLGYAFKIVLDLLLGLNIGVPE